MTPTADELAGIVDLFGGLTRGKLETAVSELAFRRGEEADPRIDDAIAGYYLLRVGEHLVAGPTALPTLPEHAEDLPHLLDVEPRTFDPGTLGEAAERRLRADAARAVDRGDAERARELLDACYDAESWGPPVETADVREALSGLAGDGG